MIGKNTRAAEWSKAEVEKRFEHSRQVLERDNIKRAAWLEHIHGPVPGEVADVARTVSLLSDRLHNDGDDAVSTDLQRVDVEVAHPTHLLAVLRFLFNSRHLIESWGDLERRVRAVFETMGLDPKRLMKGLDVDGRRIVPASNAQNEGALRCAERIENNPAREKDVAQHIRRLVAENESLEHGIEQERRAKESADAQFVQLRHRIRVHLANQHQYSRQEFCEKLAEILNESS